jgi:hypothetical protein
MNIPIATADCREISRGVSKNNRVPFSNNRICVSANADAERRNQAGNHDCHYYRLPANAQGEKKCRAKNGRAVSL